MTKEFDSSADSKGQPMERHLNSHLVHLKSKAQARLSVQAAGYQYVIYNKDKENK